jgi:hypothetical protein
MRYINNVVIQYNNNADIQLLGFIKTQPHNQE